MPIRRILPALLLCLTVLPPALSADKVLFDATKREMGGNADWVIDTDLWNQSMPAYPCTGSTNESNPGRYPTPAQSGIGPSTPGTYWTGGISSWAVELAKAGHTVESLPAGASITFGVGSNPQDLSNYDLFIIPEPQNPFTAAEKTAILNFVNAGGGLFMVADHETSDRDCDGWDSPNVFNDLTGATGTSATGVFGIWFRVDGLDVKGEDWFDDGIDNNVTTNPADPIIHGPFGDGSGGLGFFGATSMDINPAIATAHVWRTGQPHNELRVTFATATYGAGRVAAIGDSSPADDDSGDPGDTLYPGWDLATGGVQNKEIHLNACHWLLNPTPDTTAPVITAGPAAAAADCSATVTWTTDENATSGVAYGPTVAYGDTAGVAGHLKDHGVPLSGLAPSTTYHYQVSSTDAAGNGPTQSADHTFATTAAAFPVITAGPAVTNLGGASATITWTTNEAATSQVEYGLSASYGSSASVAGTATAHSVTVTGLTPETLYHFRVNSTDACGNGPVQSLDDTFTTGPASLDISGWVLKQFNSTQTFTLPSGTVIPSGGYLVLVRDATQASFEAVYGALPAGTVYLNSNATGSCGTAGCFPLINGAETFELWNGTTMEDGTTIAMSANTDYRRNNPGDAAGLSGSWSSGVVGTANPGAGAGTGSGAGVVINEMADAAAYPNEFIELYYDAGAAPSDTTPPAAAADLAALALSDTQIRLAWTAPGDDGATGTAAAYDLRMSASPITSDALFNAAAPVAGLPAPAGAGSGEQFTVSGLAASTTYHFALKTRDEVPNWSALSNPASAATMASSDITPPAPIADLAVTPQSDTVVRLAWTAPGDDGNTGTATVYSVRRSASRILTDADFDAATVVAGMTAPKAAGGAETFDVTGLIANTAYYFAVKTKDEASPTANWSGLSNWTSATTGTGGGGGGANHLVISQVQTNGDGGTPADDEFVELYNPTGSAVSIAGWSLQYRSSSGTSWSTQLNISSGSVPSHGYFLIARSAYNGSPARDLLNGAIQMSGTAGTIALVGNQTALGSPCANASIVDKVAWGTGTGLCPETAATATPAANNSIVRRPGGTQGAGTDTDNNSSDFQSQVPSVPHNSSSAPATPPSGIGNVGPTLYLSGSGATGLAWAKAVAATSYRVYRGTAADFMAGAPAPWQTVVANSVTDSSSPSPIYVYVVHAWDGTNESAD
jgi:hypothetical protein